MWNYNIKFKNSVASQQLQCKVKFIFFGNCEINIERTKVYTSVYWTKLQFIVSSYIMILVLCCANVIKLIWCLNFNWGYELDWVVNVPGCDY